MPDPDTKTLKAMIEDGDYELIDRAEWLTLRSALGASDDAGVDLHDKLVGSGDETKPRIFVIDSNGS